MHVTAIESRALSDAFPIELLDEPDQERPTLTLTGPATAQTYWRHGANCTHSSQHSKDDGRRLNWFQRFHQSEHGTLWFGEHCMLDPEGRRWERPFNAVVDDFGNLVEVPQ